ncbi:hypothetical protein Fot_42234 [Forsythia ovata]|uniref:Uncharacterized protein n=1 Tax=Forsythia ovata TaxID=205694 RepID=A0ABD1RKN8_9LAMI
MLVQENKAGRVISRGRIIDKENGIVEARAPAASHFHPYSDPRDFRRYQPFDPLKEQEHRPTKSANAFDQLGDKADSHQRRPSFIMGEGIHRSDNHNTEECPNVRATVDNMVENTYRPTGKIKCDSLRSHDP